MIRLNIEKMIAGGKGLARSGGKIFFVEGALPGETVSVRVLSETKNYAEAETVSVEKSSPARIEPRCPAHFRPSGNECREGLFCGGCDWQHAAYPEQLNLKKEIVADALRRIGKMKSLPTVEIEPSPAQFRYRNKAIIPCAAAATGPLTGFYARGSHKIVPVADCVVQPEIVFKIAAFVAARAPALGIKMYDEKSAAGSLRHIFVRVTAASQEVLTAFVIRSLSDVAAYSRLASNLAASFPEIKGVLVNENAAATNVIFGRNWRLLKGVKSVAERFSDGTVLRLSEGAFFQVNTGVAEKLYAYAASAFADGKLPVVLDLYGGVGGFALAVRRAVREVVSVEENPAAVNDALVNARSADAGNATFYAIAVEKFIHSAKRYKGAGVIADPPRSGMSPAALKGLTSISPGKIVYVSCDAATFARDAKSLCESGYHLSEIKAFDMFPQTHHVEIASVFLPRR